MEAAVLLMVTTLFLIKVCGFKYNNINKQGEGEMRWPEKLEVILQWGPLRRNMVSHQAQ